MQEDSDQQTLVVEDDDLNIYSVPAEIKLLCQEQELIDYVYKNYKDFDSFDIYIHARHMDRLLQSGILEFDQVRRVTFYFDSMDDRLHGSRSLSGISRKFTFCLKREVANRIQNDANLSALKSTSLLNPEIVKSSAKERRCRVRRKQRNLKILSPMVAKHNVGFNARNIDIIPIKYFCELCGYILRSPVQLCCGHRICRPCMQNSNGNTVTCPECDEETLEIDIFLDRGFKNDMRTLDIICSLCDWNNQFNEYENHLHQCHPVCGYCDEMFESAEHLTVHQRSNCSTIIVPCILKDYGCSNTINRFEMGKHYLTKEHQLAIIKVIHHLSNNMLNIRYENQFEANATQLQGVNELINVFASGIQALNGHAQRLNTESLQLYNKIDVLAKDFAALKLSVREQNGFLDSLTSNQEMLQQDVTSIKQKLEDLQFVSYDGTLIWKIVDFAAKMGKSFNDRIHSHNKDFYFLADAQSERQTSIYSPPFYSSPTGYKMRVRLYLHGDGNARGTHMSLFFVLMRSEYDAILKFPFNYKVAFCLYDQTSAQKHITDSFRPDVKSNSFQRPRSEMNIASGIPKFIPLTEIRQENTPYVRDNTMFLKIMVDFVDMPKTILQYAFGLNPALPANIQQNMIKQEGEKRAQQNPSSSTT